MTSRITLQNTPSRKGAVARSVSFDSHGNLLQGALYLPETATALLPAVVVTGAWTTVKEQMAGTYARELAVRGYAALAFDFTGWGQSEVKGHPVTWRIPPPRQPTSTPLSPSWPRWRRLTPPRISGVGICASSGYMAAAVADDDHFQRVALVAPWLHDPAMAEAIYGGTDAVAGLVAASEAEGAADTILLGTSTTDANAVMVQVPYYTEADRGLIPAYDNKFSVASWKPWLTYDAQASADRLTKPMLMVGSPAIALPAGAEAYAARARASVKTLWLGKDVAQFDFYDREDVVIASADAIAEFLAV